MRKWLRRQWPYIGLAIFVVATSYSVGATWKQGDDLSAEQKSNEAQQAQIAALATAAIEATGENRRTLCAAGRIVAANPLTRLPSEKPARFQRRIRAYRVFLHLLDGIDCKTVLLSVIHPRRRGGDAQTPSQSGSQPPRGESPRPPATPPRDPRPPRNRGNGRPSPGSGPGGGGPPGLLEQIQGTAQGARGQLCGQGITVACP